MRLGLHRHEGHADAKFRDYVERVRPPMVKFMNSFPDDLAAWCVSKGTQVVGRVYFEDQPLGAGGGRAVRRVVDSARAHPSIKYFELYNEGYQNVEAERYAELSIEFIDAMRAEGRIACIGSFSEGTPEPEYWRKFRPAIEHAVKHGAVLCLHEYSGPQMRYTETWRCLRYRRALAEFASWGTGAERIKIFLGETGVDDVIPRPGPHGKGWRSYYQTEWDRPPLSPEGDFADQMLWYCRELTKDENIVGVVDFGWGQAGDWETFDLSKEPAMLEKMITTMQTLPVGHFGGVPVPTPVPTPSDVLAALLRGHLGARFTDVRASMPQHATLRFGALNLAALVGIAAHHSASPREQTPLQIAQYHVTKADPFAGIGYHFVIRMGHVYMVGDINTARAHVAGRNHQLIGICTTGDLTVTAPRTEDTTALRDVVVGLDAFLGRALPVDGHGGWALPGHATACPGALASIAKGIRSAPTPAPGPDVARLIEAAKAEHLRAGVRLNPGSAIQRTMLADGIWPTTNETTAEGVTFARGESAAAGAWVYWWREGRVHKAKIA